MSRYSSGSWRSYQPGAGSAGAPVAPTSGRVRPLSAAPCRILGLDPGSVRTGYGLIDCSGAGERHVAHGCVNAGRGDFVLRLRRIFEAIAALIDEYRPDEIAIERVFVHRNPDSALKLGQARGAAICAAVAAGASAHEYAPRAIKLAISGFGAADKTQVARMVTTLLGLPRRPVADAADALAVALCHAQVRRLALLGAPPAAARSSARRRGQPAARAGGRAGVRAGVRA
jgi:crossover junction endodeoxyribonuclease RuvC